MKYFILAILIALTIGLLVPVTANAGCQVIMLPDGRMVQYCCFPNGNCQIIG